MKSGAGSPTSVSAAASPEHVADVGIVAIGRNEGDRLRRCFDALPIGSGRLVYVDSASTDDSVAQARRRGIEVVELDMSVPFTAARARNAGLRRLIERWPALQIVQFIDGDCVLAPGWLKAAMSEMEADPRLAVVCGRRREALPDASVYNRLCDIEWDTPVGEALSCGGDALARVNAVIEAGGFDDGLVAGEEPELCARLRARGWRIRRIDCEMVLHDAAMTHWSQWWRRTVRSGYGMAEVGSRYPSLWRREKRSSIAWGLLLPAAAVVSVPFTHGWGLGLLVAYAVLWGRVLLRRRARGDSLRVSAWYATFCVAAKFAEIGGAAKYGWNRIRGLRGRLIEYK